MSDWKPGDALYSLDTSVTTIRAMVDVTPQTPHADCESCPDSAAWPHPHAWHDLDEED